jgi:hypothetical protein
MLRNNSSILTDHDAVGISLDPDRASDRAGRDRVFVVVEAHQTGLRDRRRHRMEAIEPTGIGNELGVLDPSILKTERPPVNRVRSNDYCARRNAPDLAAAPSRESGFVHWPTSDIGSQRPGPIVCPFSRANSAAKC